MIDLSILDEPYEVSDEHIDFYAKNAFVKLKHVLREDVLEHFNSLITEKVIELNIMHLPFEQRDTYDRAFLQVTNIWTRSEAVKRLVFSSRLARIAAQLMQTTGVRLYHDQALYKEPGGGHTPWHADQYYWPLSSDRATTAWIPLQATPLEMGPLEFSARSDRAKGGRDLAIGDSSEERIAKMLRGSDYEHFVESFDIGEISFHSGWMFHRAGPNTTATARRVICVIYIDEAMRLAEPKNSNQHADHRAWCPGARIGELIDTPLNPVLFSQF